MKFKRVSDMKKCSKYQLRACKIPVVDLMSIDKINLQNIASASHVNHF